MVSTVKPDDEIVIAKRSEANKFLDQSKHFFIDPRLAFSRRWDVWWGGCLSVAHFFRTLILLIFTALVTPYEVAFLETSWKSVLFWVNRIVDLSFMYDIGVNCFLAYYENEEGQWITLRSRIIKHYAKGWLTIDIISVLPFDVVGEVWDLEMLSQFKIFRIVRLLRLIKLLRMFRASRILARWEATLGISYAFMSLVKFLTFVMIMAHWSACFWGMVPDFEEAEENWYTNYGIELLGAGEKYLAALYWAVMTVSTIGYGDIQPVTTLERLAATICMLFGASVYAYIIGAVCGIVSQMDPASSQYHQAMDQLNLYMDEIQLPQKIRIQARDYFHHCRQMYRNLFYQRLLLQMSPDLRGKISAFSHGEWISNIPFFNSPNKVEREQFIPAIALKLVPKAYGPKELVIREGEATEFMYIVQRGLVARLGRVLGTGKFFGEDMILHNARRHYDVRSLTFVDAYALSKTSLETVLEKGEFPSTKKLIRRATIRLALQREVVKLAAAKRLCFGLRPRTQNDARRLSLTPSHAAYLHDDQKARLTEGGKNQGAGIAQLQDFLNEPGKAGGAAPKADATTAQSEEKKGDAPPTLVFKVNKGVSGTGPPITMFDDFSSSSDDSEFEPFPDKTSTDPTIRHPSNDSEEKKKKKKQESKKQESKSDSASKYAVQTGGTLEKLPPPPGPHQPFFSAVAQPGESKEGFPEEKVDASSNKTAGTRVFPTKRVQPLPPLAAPHQAQVASPVHSSRQSSRRHSSSGTPSPHMLTTMTLRDGSLIDVPLRKAHHHHHRTVNGRRLSTPELRISEGKSVEMVAEFDMIRAEEHSRRKVIRIVNLRHGAMVKCVEDSEKRIQEEMASLRADMMGALASTHRSQVVIFALLVVLIVIALFLLVALIII